MFTRSLHLFCSRLLKSRHVFSSARMIQSRKGSELVEAAISLPILILSVMLMLRLFTFCLEILSAGIHEHLNALEAWDSYRGGGINKYSTEREIEMMRGGLLRMNVTKDIRTNLYLINEDVLVRAGEIFD